MAPSEPPGLMSRPWKNRQAWLSQLGWAEEASNESQNPCPESIRESTHVATWLHHQRIAGSWLRAEQGLHERKIFPAWLAANSACFLQPTMPKACTLSFRLLYSKSVSTWFFVMKPRASYSCMYGRAKHGSCAASIALSIAMFRGLTNSFWMPADNRRVLQKSNRAWVWPITYQEREIESFPSVQKVVVHVHVIDLDFTFIVQYLFHASCPIYGFF